MKLVSIARPFAGGYRSDAPDYALGTNETAFAQDLIYPKGIAQQRWGWAYDGTSQVLSEQLAGVVRAKFPLIGATRTAVTTSDTGTNKGRIYAHNESSAGTAIWDNPSPSPSVSWLPRCVYNGEVIFCAQDGETPLLRWAGSTKPTVTVSAKNWKMVNGTVSIATDGTGSGFTVPITSVEKGMFASARYPKTSAGNSINPMISAKILGASGSGANYTSLTLDTVRNYSLAADSAVVSNAVTISAIGSAWPAVSVNDSGTVTRTSNTANVSSTWTVQDSSYLNFNPITDGIYADALLVLNNTAGGAHRIANITGISGAAYTVGAEVETQTNAAYRLLRRCPFKDAAVHKGSFFGTGVKQYPNRVYVAPPGWNMGIAPLGVEPYDPVASAGYSNATVTGFTDLADFILTPFDIPSAYDGDDVTAILSSPGPLLVLKRDSVYGIFGSWPNFEVQLVTSGAGCIDLRAAVTVDGVAYWAGTDGVFQYRFGQVQSLTDNKVQREWRALMSGYSTTSTADYISFAESSGSSSPVVFAPPDGTVTFTTCTSTTRPSSPANGNWIFETDTGKYYERVAGAWVEVTFPTFA